MKNRDSIAICLEIIAAKAKQLAEDVRNGRLWEGELGSGLSVISEQLERASREGGRQNGW